MPDRPSAACLNRNLTATRSQPTAEGHSRIGPTHRRLTPSCPSVPNEVHQLPEALHAPTTRTPMASSLVDRTATKQAPAPESPTTTMPTRCSRAAQSPLRQIPAPRRPSTMTPVESGPVRHTVSVLAVSSGRAQISFCTRPGVMVGARSTGQMGGALKLVPALVPPPIARKPRSETPERGFPIWSGG
jgi:hypothetical protein